MRCWVCDQQFSILQWSSAPAERQDFLWFMMFMKQQEMLWKIQALEDFLNKAFAAAKEELSQPMQMITLCHFDITQLFYWTSMHAISSRITCSSSQGPLHGSIAWVHCILNSLTKSWWKSLKRSLRWNWLVEKVYILWVWQTNPAERYIAPSGAFQILQHVCVCAESSYVPISTFSTVKYCQNVFAKSIIPETSRQPSGCFPSTEHLQHLWRHDIHVLLPKMTGAIAYLDRTDSHSRLARTLETYLMTPRQMFIVSQTEKVTKWHSRKFQTSDGHRAARMQDLEVLSGSQLGLHIAFHRTLPKPVT